jgi:hypothetical protein
MVNGELDFVAVGNVRLEQHGRGLGGGAKGGHGQKGGQNHQRRDSFDG